LLLLLMMMMISSSSSSSLVLSLSLDLSCVPATAARSGMVPLLFLNTKKKKQLEDAALLRDLSAEVARHAADLACDSATLFVANPTSTTPHLFSVASDGSVCECVAAGGAVSPQLPVAAVGAPVAVTAEHADALRRCVAGGERYVVHRPASTATSVDVVPSGTSTPASSGATQLAAEFAPSSVVVMLPLRDEEGRVLGVLQLTRSRSSVAASSASDSSAGGSSSDAVESVAAAARVTALVACAVRSWAATLSSSDSEEESAAAGIRSAQQLRVAWQLALKSAM
jgi:hypothetical protein